MVATGVAGLAMAMPRDLQEDYGLDLPLSEESRARSEAEPILTVAELQAEAVATDIATLADAIAALRASEQGGEDAQRLVEQVRGF
jgi:hypothetical protein